MIVNTNNEPKAITLKGEYCVINKQGVNTRSQNKTTKGHKNEREKQAYLYH